MTNQASHTASPTNQSEGRTLGSYTFDEAGSTLNSAVADLTFDTQYQPISNAAVHTAAVSNLSSHTA